MYPNTQLFISGVWRAAASGETLSVENPATDEVIGTVAKAGRVDLDAALQAAQAGFEVWRKTSAMERAKVLRRAAELLRERAPEIAKVLTQEQGKPLAQSLVEANTAADVLEWFAEEARRTYGRVIPARIAGVVQRADKEPVGPVAAFTPWNFPIMQAVRKVGAAMAAGCSVILKGPEETPAACAELVRALADAGTPAGVVNLVFGSPAEISSYLIPHPIIRKISFTGSTAVGKHLAALAGQHMKRVTMELGGHAPVVVFKDADIAGGAKILAQNKVRNAGQVCVSPTRFLVQDEVYGDFIEQFTAHIATTKVGDGLEAGVEMGPLANPRRLEAVEALVADAVQQGAELRTGGKRIGNKGSFFEPTVLVDVPTAARAMNEEPFGPVALFSRFSTFDEAMVEANRLPFGLGAYLYTGSLSTANAAASAMESGMVSVNHQALGLIETPFGGVKDSGYGSEGGSEAIEAYLNTKFVTFAA
ncbi:NAD-dependent succinate-semialdehyde dehydrogenase [Caulobacter sp. S45]|uniref:NAD-dependent succinate-semialdehyde dehydrogenase n=1 Tax=Caulobacter sp. S45 TaxID=1641861 RepID=UPI00131DF9DF|nr:NAD-dependent succinate-semialdehyde dehydrogenase [Caulobacter sp. S45]